MSEPFGQYSSSIQYSHRLPPCSFFIQPWKPTMPAWVWSCSSTRTSSSATSAPSASCVIIFFTANGFADAPTSRAEYT